MNKYGKNAVFLILMCSMMGSAKPKQSPRQHTTWSTYLGSADASHYSALKQIDGSNVSKLQAVWSYESGDERAYEFNPIVAGKTMYVLAKDSAIVALDAATGKELWVYRSPALTQRRETHRGINYWQSADGSDKRLLITFDNKLEAISADNGQRITSFGNGGLVDLKEGLGRRFQYHPSDPIGHSGDCLWRFDYFGFVYGRGLWVSSGRYPGLRREDRAMVWIFHTIPHPGEPGYDTWPKDAWKYGGGTNCWGEMSLDESTGIVYIPTGSPVYDFYGANRKGNNLFSDSLIALNARTGKLIWYYQLVHHDLWDYDAMSAPQLLTIRQNGKDVGIVAQASKQGFVYVFDRATGKPLWPIEERPVPKSDMPEEQASPTQPFPVKPPPFARQSFTVADINPYILSPADRARWVKVVENARNEGLFTPPGLTDTIEMPGNHGGANWGDDRRGSGQWVDVCACRWTSPRSSRMSIGNPRPCGSFLCGRRRPCKARRCTTILRTMPRRG